MNLKSPYYIFWPKVLRAYHSHAPLLPSIPRLSIKSTKICSERNSADGEGYKITSENKEKPKLI